MRPSLTAISFLLALTCCPIQNTALSTSVKQNPKPNAINRRDAFTSIIAIGAGTAFLPISHANAAEDNQVISDEEMAARVARKQELLRSSKSSGGGRPPVGASDIRSDVNPDAAVSLRSRSAIENAKIAMAKQKELNSRDKAQKREDLCEMLGRGC